MFIQNILHLIAANTSNTSSALNSINLLMSNPLIDKAVDIIITIILTISTIFIEKRSQESQIPCSAIKTSILAKEMNKRFPNLKIDYNGQLIERLTLTRIAFWNAGKKKIDKEDITGDIKQLKISLKGSYKILDIVKVDQKSKDRNNLFSYDFNNQNSYFTVAFEYISKNEGAIFEIAHTGTNSDDLYIDSTVKGVGEFKTIFFDREIQ